MSDQLILVDEEDNAIGHGEKMEVHEKGQLHRAFSIFVVNDKNELMLQKRALHKYHSGGLWANTCCSHPIKSEDQEVTVKRRLMEEMGFTCEIKPLFSFIYKASLDHGLTEHEFDHVYLGHYEGSPSPNPDEVGDWRWIGIETLKTDLVENSDQYVYWLQVAFQQFYDEYSRISGK